MSRFVIITLACCFFSTTGCKPRLYNSGARALDETSPATAHRPPSFTVKNTVSPQEALLKKALLMTDGCALAPGKTYMLKEPARPSGRDSEPGMWVDPLEKIVSPDGTECALDSGWLHSDIATFDAGTPPPPPPPVAHTEEAQPGAAGSTGTGRPALVDKFIQTFANCVMGTGYQQPGSWCGETLDCSRSIAVVWKKLGYAQPPNPPFLETDTANFVSCKGGPYKPGDHILLGYPGRESDHWITLVKVGDSKHANSTKNTIVDQSSDCAPGCKIGHMRDNLARREVRACARHKALVAAWKAEGQ